MKLEIISPDGLLFEGEAEEVSFPGISGSFDVLPYHAPLIAALGTGVIRFRSGKEVKQKTIQSGFVEVKQNSISVCIE